VPERLGIVAGGGALPRRLADAAKASGRDPVVIALEGWAKPGDFSDLPCDTVGVAKVGRLLDLLKRQGCREVVLAGTFARPDYRSLVPDLRGLAVLPKVITAGGDDAILRVVVGEFESEGFRVIGADDVLADLLAPAGQIGRVAPDEDARRDVARGLAVLAALGPVDVGQAVIVQDGIVLGIEAAEGTDALIARCGALAKPGKRGALIKLHKAGQERRVDLPTVGGATVANLAKAGFAGIAVEAGATLILDREEMLREADAAGLFVVGIDPAHGV